MVDQRIFDDYENHAADLIAYATVLSGPDLAEDVVSEAIVRIVGGTDWQKVREPRGYLFRCVLNEARRQSKRTALGRTKEQQIQPPAEFVQEIALDTAELFAPLSVRERSCIYLTYWEDMSVADVALFLGISDGSVRRLLARARAKLRKELQR